MVNLIVQVSKYILVILIAVYTLKCFTVFRSKHEVDRGSVYLVQNIIMFMIHFLIYFLLFINTMEIRILIFYGVQVVALLAALILYSNFYKSASRLLTNNMCFLLMIGFAVLTRLDYDLAVRQFGIAIVAVGLSLAIPVILSHAGFLERLGIVYGVASLALIASVFVLGTEFNGANNWITIFGFSFQPSELAKVVFVFFVASFFAKDTSFKRVVITTILAAAHVLLLVAATDLGAAVIFFITYLVMLYVATEKGIYMFLGGGAGCAAAVVAYNMFSHIKVRVSAWLHPWGDMENTSYQIAQSLFAIGTGSWFGSGIYQGMPEQIPIVESDFIFAAISEEFGTIFSICLILIYLSCFIMFINISLQLTRPFYKVLATGLSVAYGFQVFLCIGGVTKLIPHTGVTLPLISYGGSSVISTIVVFAVIQGLYLLRKKEVLANEE